MEKPAMIPRVDVKPELLRWARKRSGIGTDALVEHFPKYREWERGDSRPTLKQLERLARVTCAPIGSFFLSKPLEERLPIPDLRTVGDKPFSREPSVDLLDTIYLCQQRQYWYRTFALTEGDDPLGFVGSATLDSDIESTATEIRNTLGMDLDERRSLPTSIDALRRFVTQADSLGILVMSSGIVANNTRRKLDPDEFRGFALADDFAPLVFVNASDTKSAQLFTLAHELAHIWLGASAVTDVEPISMPSQDIESWCNRVAAEILVPSTSLECEFEVHLDLGSEIQRLADYYKVSTLVILRRIFDTGAIDRETLAYAYQRELNRIWTIRADRAATLDPTLGTRVGKRFGRALVASALSGRSSFSEALRLLCIKKMSTLRRFAASLETTGLMT